jgi:hypothetical protein
MPERGKGAKGKGDEQRGVIDSVDALYQLPLAEFTPARNAMASRLKKAGRQDEANDVKALLKPSLPAWTVNQLFWHHRPAFDALMSVGEKFRQAQARQLSGQATDLRGPLEERREALSSLAKLAAATLRDAGSTPAPDTIRRITSTLEALSTLGDSPDGPRAGRLVDDVDPPGFESLAALVPRTGDGDHPAGGPSRILAFRQQKRAAKAPPRKHESTDEGRRREEEERREQLKQAKAAVQDAERELKAARKAAEQAEAALKKVAQQTKEAERGRLEAERRLEKAGAAVDEARQQARKTAAAAEEAAQAVEDAERILEKAKGQLSEMT